MVYYYLKPALFGIIATGARYFPAWVEVRVFKFEVGLSLRRYFHFAESFQVHL